MKVITIAGNLGKSAEVQSNQKGEFITFSVAVTEGSRDNQKTNWFSCISYQTNIAQYLQKGTKVVVTGSLSIEEKGENGLEEERRLAYVGITRAKKIAKISFSMNRFYQGDWMDSMASRFVDELPDEFIKKNNNFNDGEETEFEFNQDIDFESEVRSPGWLRYQKKLK
mgnify:CR=1 FL=1